VLQQKVGDSIVCSCPGLDPKATVALLARSMLVRESRAIHTLAVFTNGSCTKVEVVSRRADED
jgi:hypothetical protein